MNLDDKKIAIITCVNNEELYEESMVYVRHLAMPEGMEVELIAVWQAVSMTSGYQEAMRSTNAKYKIYMHQDCFPCNRNLLLDIVRLFRSDASIGAIGVAGSGDLLAERPIWWCSERKYGAVYNKQAYEFMQVDEFGMVESPYVEVVAIDGVFMATQYDLPWRTELFTGWHFYDISQSREFINAGYKVIIPHQERPWVIHFAGKKVLDKEYKKYMAVFCQNYCK